MTCERCGAPCQGRLCADCETIERCEKKYGTAADDPGRDTTEDKHE